MRNLVKEARVLVSMARTADFKKAAIPFYDILPSWCFPERNLRFKAYCIGMGKTGTNSIHAIFSKQHRSAHEPEARFFVPKILAFAKGTIDKSQFTRYVKHRERRLGLEMNSAGFNYFIMDVLVNEFSNAKFILTIRDCYSWLDSQINHQIIHRAFTSSWFGHHWNNLNDLRFRTGEGHANEEAILAEKGLYTLDGYFSYWREHNSKVLAIVPEERLLVVKTREINQNLYKIESFLGIAPGTLPHDIHENVRRRKFNILSQIDKDFLEEKACFHCKELMDKYFPEVKGFNNY